MRSLFVTFYSLFIGIVIGGAMIQHYFQIDAYRQDVEDDYRSYAEHLTQIILNSTAHLPDNENDIIESIISPLKENGDLIAFSVTETSEKADDISDIEGALVSKTLSLDISEEVDTAEILVSTHDGRSFYYKFSDAYSESYMRTYYINQGMAFVFSMIVLLAFSLIVSRYFIRLRESIQVLSTGDFIPNAPQSRVTAFQELSDDVNSLAIALDSNLKQQVVFNTALHHETRIPLQRLRLALDMARSTKDYGHLEDFLSDMDIDLTELTHITEEMLVVSRLRLDPDSMPVESLNITQCCKAIIDDFPDTTITLNIENGQQQNTFEVEDCYLYFNRILFNLMIRNLISNAAKFCKSRICISLIQTESYTTVSVEDDGPGIQEAHRAKVFEPFVQASHDHAEKDGIGIGLALVKNIVEHSHGQLVLDQSERCSGAKITMTWQPSALGRNKKDQ